MTTTFNDELQFEAALVELLSSRYGWETAVLHHPTEADLLRNWADILYANNNTVDRLNNAPLTEGEMQQIVEQINSLRTPLRLNGFINGKTVAIRRDNPADPAHLGREVSLKIYDRHEIAAGQSRYQIVRQPQFATASAMRSNRRGDVLLLINGMPLIHLELKKSGIPLSQACHQIAKYAGEGIFEQGLFALVQVFVAMTPEETRYFANPGPEGRFNPDYYFSWADFNNEPINAWHSVAASLLSIPMAHQLIGFYTVADSNDGQLKVMRSYQYHAVNAISDKVARTRWADRDIYGGFVWHTTGSGKTMTSFKAAQLIANSNNADKVIFLVDRIELGTQSLREYRSFADESEEVQGTENTGVLITKLKSDAPQTTLIVTSIQKMSNIDDEGSRSNDIAQINRKRIVFIVDEAHRTVFGEEMLPRIKRTFPAAIFFGFTGTPILEDNNRHGNTTADVFGGELHRYSIADGIRDKNVLGFDPYMLLTYRDRDLRQAVALHEAKAATVAEAMNDEAKKTCYLHYMNTVPMAGKREATGNYTPGIEDYIPDEQYERAEHREAVVGDILTNWETLSQAGKFHALLATSSIPEAIAYYRLFRQRSATFKVAALFDASIDNNGRGLLREEALDEMLSDYNQRYDQSFTIARYGNYKKDVARRLAHKMPYLTIDRQPDQQLDLLIVVDQMLTGFDSKWVNTLYVDKMLKYHGLIQAFSRTNRLFGPDKPFGTIRYYRRPHSIARNIDQAFRVYSGGSPLSLFADKLQANLNAMNEHYSAIEKLFEAAEIVNFERLPDEFATRKEFVRLFQRFNNHLQAAKVQGFHWRKLVYEFRDAQRRRITVELRLNETTYLVLVLRYKELVGGGGGGGGGDIPYDIDTHLTEINTDRIDVDYMNSRFDKYLKLLQSAEATGDEGEKALNELFRTFATLSQEDQAYANQILHDVQRGSLHVAHGRSLRDYITEYRDNAHNDRIRQLSTAIGIDEEALRALMALHPTDSTLNDFGRFDSLKQTIDRAKAKAFLERIEGAPILLRNVSAKISAYLSRFILADGFDVE